MHTPTFAEAITSAAPEQQDIARRLRTLVYAVHPDAVEVAWPNQGIIGYGVGPKKMSEHYAYIAPQSKHVNLGFMYGASLDDPDGLLEGTGKKLRHVKIRSAEEIERPALQRLLEQAVDERRTALG